jgi:hypothetical protein
MFPMYIRISPKCWMGHDWHKWMAYSEETDHTELYGICSICSKEKYWYNKGRKSEAENIR